jgi:hypothetical protein
MTETVYVELDALLDTRLAVVSSLDQEAAVRLVQSEAYYQRQSDDFSAITGIDHAVYLEAYQKRHVGHLARSIKTRIPLLLHELILKLEEQEESTPYRESTDLEVNVWPYVDLTEGEREALMLAVMVHAGIQTLPRVVCFDPKSLTPEVLKRKYSGLILYNLREWLQHHVTSFIRTRTPQVAVLAPGLFNGKIVGIEDVAPAELLEDPNFRKDLSPLRLTEIACAEYFGLDYLAPEHFSIWR